MSETVFPEIDANVVVAEALMLRAESETAILIVEGSSDERMLWDFIDHDRCTMVIAEGKEYATDAVSILVKDGVKGVICLVDRDFDDFLGLNHANDNTIVTSLHDMEMLVVHSQALDKVFREMGSKSKLKRLKDAGETPLARILEAAYPLAVLQLISLRDHLYLKFNGLNLRSFDRKTLLPDEKGLCRDIINHSKSNLAVDDLHTLLVAEKENNYDRPIICCGHNVTELIGKSLQSLLGSKNAVLVTPEEIESRLRLAFSWTDFTETSVYSDVRAWEARNADYRVLRQAA